jgi:HlyD family secretion protein
VSALYPDFNDRVRKGQLIARIDPTLQEQAVRDAEAGLERSQAELGKAERDHGRMRALFDTQVVTESELNAAEYALSVARAGAKSAQITLERAQRNLAYTSIYAPIDGVVVERNVDVGQTVAASLSAPQLFLIANDLSRMRILAAVDESDIGQIRTGLPVRFTVPAYPEDTFTGVVTQVRLQSTVRENVVNYTVTVSVPNTSGKLLPGMTATVNFITASARAVLLVPNAALRFRPSAAKAAADTVTAGRGAARTGRPETARSETYAHNGTLWYLAQDGSLASVPVSVGISDGQRTAIECEDVSEGTRIIVAVVQKTPSSTTASPFTSTPQPGPGPGRGGPF